MFGGSHPPKQRQLDHPLRRRFPIIDRIIAGQSRTHGSRALISRQPPHPNEDATAMAHSSSSSSSSSSRRGENVLFLITHAMLHENATECAPFQPSIATELWPYTFMAVASNLAASSNQCHFLVSESGRLGLDLVALLRESGFQVTGVALTSSPWPTGAHGAAEPDADASAPPSSDDLERGLAAFVEDAPSRTTPDNCPLEGPFVDESVRLLMTCIDYRPTVVVTGQSALHLALPIAFKHNIPLAMIEAHGPLNAIKLNASAAPSPIRACMQRLARHEKARTRKQVELANALLRSLDVGKTLTLRDWRMAARRCHKIHAINELNFPLHSGAVGHAKAMETTHFCGFPFEAVFSPSDRSGGGLAYLGKSGSKSTLFAQPGRSNNNNSAAHRASSLAPSPAHAPTAAHAHAHAAPECMVIEIEPAVVPARMEGFGLSHGTGDEPSLSPPPSSSSPPTDESLERFFNFGAPVIGVWLDADLIAGACGAKNRHQHRACMASLADLILGALSDLQFKAVIVNTTGGSGFGPTALRQMGRGGNGRVNGGVNGGPFSEPGAGLLSYCEGNVKEVNLSSTKDLVRVLSRCRAVIHHGNASSVTTVSHLGLPSVVLPVSRPPPPPPSSAGNFKSDQTALANFYLTRTLEELGVAVVSSPFGSCTRIVMASFIRKASCDERMNENCVDMLCRLDLQDTVPKCVSVVEKAIVGASLNSPSPTGSTWHEQQQGHGQGTGWSGRSAAALGGLGGLGGGVGGVGGEEGEEAAAANGAFDCAYMSSSQLEQRGGPSPCAVKFTRHKFRIPWVIELEWTVREGEDKFRFDSLKGHGQLA